MKEIEGSEGPIYDTINEGAEYEVIQGSKAGGCKLPLAHGQEEFAMKECPAYLPTTVPGGEGSRGVVGEGEGVYMKLSH